MQTDLKYQYSKNSVLVKEKSVNKLLLAHQTEIQEINNIPCFFWGNLVEPYITAKCWATIAKTVRSSFGPIPASLRDPIVTAGSEKIRFEGFSSCNGVYVRLDMKPTAIDGEFLASGTTNVDFNEPILNALNSILKNDKVTLAVGQNEMQVITKNEKVVEKKVTLPPRWIKGLTSVQVYLAEMELVFELNKIQFIQLFQSIPKGATKGDYFIVQKGGKFAFSNLAFSKFVKIGGVTRLRLIENLLPLVQHAYIFQSTDEETCAILMDLEKMQFLITLSPQNNREFSGEGKALESLTQSISEEYIMGLNSVLKANEVFEPTMFAIENDIEFATMDHLQSSLSSIGLLGYDVLERQHFYRRLPFKMERILSYNPRLKNANKLIDNNQVEILENSSRGVVANVSGTGVMHIVKIASDGNHCTCDWFSRYQGKRGICKHILAVKIVLNKED